MLSRLKNVPAFNTLPPVATANLLLNKRFYKLSFKKNIFKNINGTVSDRSLRSLPQPFS
jgi:hypothetical protein